MEKREIVEGVKDILKDSLRDTIDIGEINDDTNLLEEIHLDSIQAMEILLRIEEKFDIIIEDEDLNKKLFSSLSSLGDYISNKIKIK
jgi:acyl carrier protein